MLKLIKHHYLEMLKLTTPWPELDWISSKLDFNMLGFPLWVVPKKTLSYKQNVKKYIISCCSSIIHQIKIDCFHSVFTFIIVQLQLSWCCLYFLGQGQDDHLLESPSCIRFLIRLLKPIAFASIEEKLPKIGSKLLALRTGADSLHNSNKRLDSSSAAIFSKVHEVLVSCKEIKSIQGNSGTERPELCPKWIALLTMERACLSTISLEGIFLCWNWWRPIISIVYHCSLYISYESQNCLYK